LRRSTARRTGRGSANSTTAVSLAVLHAAAGRGLLLYRHFAGPGPIRLPLPEIRFGGDAHAGRRVDVQEFMVMPLGAATFAQALEMTAEVYRAAGELMRDVGKLAGVADEGGWWPAFDANDEALDWLVRAIERAGFTPGDEVAISLDIAASELVVPGDPFRSPGSGRSGRYRLGLEGRELDSDGMCEMLERWLARYPIVSIEDPLAEDDADGLARFTRAVGNRVQVIGDDFLVTSAARVTAAAARGACNAVLVKPNQAGTVTEARPHWTRNARGGAHRLRPVRRDRGRLDRASRRRLGRVTAQGRLVRPVRADGEVERGAADRGGGGGECALCRARGAAAIPGRARSDLIAINVLPPGGHLT
jgi:enolase